MMKLYLNSYFILMKTLIIYFGQKKLSREHKEYFYVAWVENVNFKNCNFRVLRSILEGFFIKQKLFKIKKYKRKVTFVF